MRWGDNMKVFVSWSGDLSRKIADQLKTWLPCIVQSADVFYSTKDIEKGETWNARILDELSNTDYGIICLTKENVEAPWINFEAGALAKNMGQSRVMTLLVDLPPSEVKGPLTSFQATAISNKNDFFELVKGINAGATQPVDNNVLQTLYDGLWEKINTDFQNVISEDKTTSDKKPKDSRNQGTQILEELVQLVRQQNSLLNTPSALLPPGYVRDIFTETLKKDDVEDLLLWIITRLDTLVDNTAKYQFGKDFVRRIYKFAKVNDLVRLADMCVVLQRGYVMRLARTEDNDEIKATDNLRKMIYGANQITIDQISHQSTDPSNYKREPRIEDFIE